MKAIGTINVMATLIVLWGGAVLAVESGVARGWGQNNNGQVGIGSSGAAVIGPAAVSGGITDFISIVGSEFGALGLRADGTVWNWGIKADGTAATSPVQVAGLSNVTAISAGQGHALALLADGTVRSWGGNAYGQLGDGTTTNRTSPVTVSGLTNVTAISAGWFHSVALISGGTVKAWGDNEYGELGDTTTTNRSTPVSVSGLTNVIAISAGADHVLALISGGTVKAWGYNVDGEVGDGSTTNRLAPVSVPGLSGVVAVAGGNEHALALLSDGTVKSWGRNHQGQLGDGTLTTRLTPVSVISLSSVAKIVSGPIANHSFAILTDKTTRSWGANRDFSGASSYQLGDNSTADQSTPANRPGLTGVIACSAGRDFSHAIVPPSLAEIAVSGNGQNIADGDSTPSSADFTDFGNVTVGSNLDRTFTIQNSGTAALSVGSVTVTGSGFSVQTQPAASVAAGSSTTFVIRFAPGAAGAVSGSVSFSNGDANENPFNFSLAGNGQAAAAPEIAVSGNGQNIADGDSTPSTADFTDFGSLVVGSSLDRTFTVQNNGTAALSVGSVSVTGSGFSVQTQPAASVAAGSSTTFVIRFAPGAAGAVSGSVSFSNGDADENPFNFSLAGNGQTVAAPEIAVLGNGQNIADGDSTPSSGDFTDFGNVSVGSSLDRTFTIQNNGTAALSVGSVAVTGSGFSVQTQPAASVAAGSSTTFVIRFAPGAAGAVSGSLSFGNGDADENPFNFSLAGNGQAATPNQAPVLGSLTATPNPALLGQTVDFSASASDADSDPLTFNWTFGDGKSGVGTALQHAYTAAGTYGVVVTVTDGKGGSDTRTLSLVVVDPGAGKLAMQVTRIRGKTNFSQPGQDFIRVSGVVPGLPQGQLFEGLILEIDFGGVSRSFQLNAKGRARTQDGAFLLKLKFEKDPATGKKVFAGGDTPFQALVKKGSWSANFAAIGMVAEAESLTLPFAIDLGFEGKVYTDTSDLLYVAKHGLGKFKSNP